ncbi:MAG TPA: RpiB/LacA/LacB family sugar-phosphate isomerase [Candidatus Coprovivens excrementavium]|nr:RpiB/LacA/LacB family sugar-phosphate isomerase [Candidatus Coprovivens excrementavium]
MKIAIATDHNGVEQKKEIIKILNEYEFLDKSPVNTSTDDYPDFAFKVANSIVNKEAEFGILLCGTGIGMSIAANKVKGIRCAHCSNLDQAFLARSHNNANIIALSYKQDLQEIIEMIRTFLTTSPSEEEKHHRRVQKIIDYERGTYNEL